MNIYIWFENKIDDVKLDDVFEVLLDFQGSTYMEITQIRAYDGQSLVGNAGGYIGLFLGVALVQLPTLIRYVLHSIKGFIDKL